MTRYPLQSVLDLRRHEEETATAHLANATRRREEAEREESRLVTAVDSAREEIRAARENSGPPSTAVEALSTARFVARLTDAWKGARERLARFRSGALVAAREAEAVAQAARLEAWRAREALEKHAAKHAAAARLAADRREEETLEEIARATGHQRGQQKT